MDMSELDEWLESPYVLEEIRTPVVVAPVSTPGRHLDRLADLPVVSVAVVDGRCDEATRDAFDVVIDRSFADPDAALAAVVDGARAHPEAATLAAQVLRAGGGLVTESVAFSTLQTGEEHRAWLANRPPMTHRPAAQPVLTERSGDGLRIEFNRPEVRNAFDSSMRDAFVDALRIAAAEPDVDVTLTGRGPAFCSGGDLAEFGTSPGPVEAHFIRSRRSAAWWMRLVGPRVTARIHGACMGAGIELAAWAGEIVATGDAFFALPEVGMGLIPGAGGTVSLPRRIGRQHTAWMAISGSRVDATTARRWGLVDRVE
jgi:hypothetical protein